MKRFSNLGLCNVVVLGTAGSVAILLLASGPRMFSPGPLNAQNRSDVALGEVHSHAQTGGNCAACHVAPWSGNTMGERCLDCHTGVGAEIDMEMPLHGSMPDPMRCRDCHTEHHGPQTALTSLSHFNHDWTSFKLTGVHTIVDCASCHRDEVHKGTPQTCVSCHAEPEKHQGRYGTNCVRCHSTSGWDGAVFQHRFPMTHGGGGKQVKACSMCHTTPNDFETYTCFLCHRHQPANTVRKHLKLGVSDVQHCATCHPSGRRVRK